MEEFAAGASGATLGYIVGNLPGAVKGWEVAKYLYKNKKNWKMPPLKRKAAYYGKRANKKFRRATAKINARRAFKGAAGGGVTFQSDSTTQYVKKRMSRGKKRNWKKFVKKVNAVDEKDYAKQTILYSRQRQYGPSGQFGNADVYKQHWGGMVLYGQKSPGDTISTEGFNDIYNALNIDVFNQEKVLGITTGGIQVQSYGNKLQSKFVFTSACMDITFSNNTFFGPGNDNINAVATMEVDVYEIGFRKTNSNATLDSFATALATATSPNVDSIIINGTGGLESSTRGVTLFEMPTFLSLYGVKIYKKTKFMLPRGHSFTYQKRDPKRHVFDFYNVDKQGEATLSGVTKGIMFCWKYTNPESLNTTPTALPECRLNVRCTRTYKYLKKEKNSDTGTVL